MSLSKPNLFIRYTHANEEMSFEDFCFAFDCLSVRQRAKFSKMSAIQRAAYRIDHARKERTSRVQLQGIGEYNPFDAIKKANVLLGQVAEERLPEKIGATTAAVNELVLQGQVMISSLNAMLSRAKDFLFGIDCKGVVIKLVRILVNALMCKPKLLLANLIFNVAIEYGEAICDQVKKFLNCYFSEKPRTTVNPLARETLNRMTGEETILVTLQSDDCLTTLGKISNFVDSHHGLCAAGLGCVIAVILQCALGLPQSRNIDATVKFFGDRSRNLKNIFDFGSVCLPIFTSIGDYLMTSIGFLRVDSELDKYLSGYDLWATEVFQVCQNPVDQPLAVRLEKDERLVFTIEKLYKQGLEYATIINTRGIREKCVAHYQRMFKIIEEARKLCDFTGVFGNRPRIKPLVIQLFGESGVGKSGMTWPLACDLNTAMCASFEEAKNFAREIYYRNTEQEFWDGYAGQNIVVWDDFGQRGDSLAAPNEEFMEIIRAANIAPYPLHMADLPEKKRTKFCSKVMILSQNVLNQSIHSLTHPDAVRRRIDVCVRVTNNDRYTKECSSLATGTPVKRLDRDKCDGPVDTAPYIMELYNPETQQPIVDPKDGTIIRYNYSEFLDLCIRKMKAAWRDSKMVNTALEERITPKNFARLSAKLQSNDSDSEYEDALDFVDDLLDPRVMRAAKRSLAKLIREKISSISFLQSTLIVVGLLLGGIGIWKHFSSQKSRKHHRPGGIVSEANASADNATKRAPTLRVEASSSNDMITRRAQRTILEGDDITVEASCSNDNRTKNLPRVCVEAADAEMQAWKDATAQDLITYRVLTNLYKIIRIRDGVECPLLNGLFVRDTIMLAPAHLLASLRATDEVRLENIYGCVFTLPWKVGVVKHISASNGCDKDAILIRWPRYINAHSDIVKHFQTMPELSVRRVDICVPTLRCVNKKSVMTILGNTKATCTAINLKHDTGELRIRDAIEYSLNTIAGDCGAPIVCQETSFIRKIAGIHIAATTDGLRAYGQSVTRADLDRTLSQFEDVIVTDADQLPGMEVRAAELQHNREYSVEEMVRICNLPCANFNPLGSCSSAPFAPNASDIRRSVIHGMVVEPTTMPSCLYSHEENIVFKNIAKCAMPTPYIPAEEVEKAVDELRPYLLNCRDVRLARVLTFEEAIAGSTDSEYIGSINRASSAGFPWVLSRKPGTHGKTGWLGTDEYLFDAEVRAAVEQRLAAAKQGIRMPTVWTATLKDERRPIEKVKARKTRVFANGPMDYTILFRMYFLGFIAHVMEERIDNEQSLGTNPFGIDWTTTAKKLSLCGDKIFAGDFSSFDGTLNACIMHRFVDIVNEFYSDGAENARVREVLFLDVFNSIQLCEGRFIGLNHSQPSGNPSTTCLNSFYNSVSMRIAYYRAAKMHGVNPPPFNVSVSMVSYGDDNVVNFNDSVAPWFNQVTVSKAYESFGMTYTDETKSGELVEYRKLTDVAYLKRGFRKDGAIWRAPMSLTTILETPNWIRKCPDHELATQMNVEDSVFELAQHDRATFDKWSKLYISAFYKATGMYPEVKSYDTYNEEWNREMGFIV